MDCRTTSAHTFREILELKKFDVILTKQQSVLVKITSLLEGENMQTQYKVQVIGLTCILTTITSQ